MKILTALRTQKTLDKYKKLVDSGFLKHTCGMCREKNVKEFTYWRIIKARFPLDKIARIDHIIMPKRHIAINKLTGPEKKELELIKQTFIGEKYDSLLEATPKAQSIPEHHHIHLLVWRKD